MNPTLQSKIASFGTHMEANQQMTIKSKKQVMASIGQTDLELMFEYFQEMATILHKKGGSQKTDFGNLKQAIEMQQKAYMIAGVIFGDENFNTFDCMINLAQLHDENGQSSKATELFQNCLKFYDRKECARRMIRGQEIDDDVHDLSFDSRSSNHMSSAGKKNKNKKK